jgi:cupin superfamily acireductone dioxygenase involved in methionine salvage
MSLIELKLKQAKEIQERISNLEKSEIFLSEKEINNELKTSEQLVQQVSRVSEQISTLKKDKSYLDLNQIRSLQEQVKKKKKMFEH